MSQGINKVIIAGNLGRDPQINGKATKISVATSRSWKDKQTGEKKEYTEWHNIVFFDKLAEIASNYLSKGSKVLVEGELKTGSYEKDGHKFYKTEIIGRQLEILSSKQEPSTTDDEGLSFF